MSFAATLVFVDTVWVAMSSLIVLFTGYFVLQFYIVKANTSLREFSNIGLFMVVGYISVLLFFEENPVPKNYVGWFYIVFLNFYISLKSVG